MKLLSIESSCDETSASVVEKRDDDIFVSSNVTATSISLHAATGGIIPENAAREQVKYILPVITKALVLSSGLTSGELVRQNFSDSETQKKKAWQHAKEILESEIDAIAITHGPGLIGSLLVGVETAKTLAYVFNKPLIPVNHLLAHIYANYINRKEDEIKFPFIGLIVSGGHTDILHFKGHNDYGWLGGTRDDAAGEAFDKIGRLLKLPYPAGPEIEQRASLVSDPTIKFKSPLLASHDFDFSFSGLKAEVMRFVQKEKIIDTNLKNQICHATQKAVIDVLIKKTLNAAQKYDCRTILVGGGVSANQTLINQFNLSILNSQLSISLFAPEKEYCTDNAAMIGAFALMSGNQTFWEKVNANPELYFA